jgi:polyhydroxyalkanoate synthesis regulator phasin
MPDAVRRAVERTVQSTVGSAGLTRDRAQELVDEVVRRAEATAGVGDRLRDAIPDIRVVTRDDLGKLTRELERLGKRLDRIEEQLAKQSTASRPARPKAKPRTTSRTPRSKP